jgi:hypothetical protein
MSSKRYKPIKTPLTLKQVLTIYTHKLVGTIRRKGDVTMSDRLRGERLQIMLSPEELSLIDDFRFDKRMPSRAATVRELFRRGLAAEGFVLAPSGTRSKDFGVNGKAARARRSQ